MSTPFIPTRYRLVPHSCVVTEYYVQFHHVGEWTARKFWLFGPKVQRRQESWRYVPNRHKEIYWPEHCPDRINPWYGAGFVRGYTFELKDLHGFVRRWPSIDDYFRSLRDDHDRHANRRAEECSAAKVIYLNPAEVTP